MNRRNFIQFAAAGAAASSRPGLAAPVTPSRPVLFHAGTQQGHTPEVLRSMAAFGPKHIWSGVISGSLDEKRSVRSLSGFRGQGESFGLGRGMSPRPVPSA